MYQLGKRKRQYRRLRRLRKAVMILACVALVVFGCYKLLHLNIKPSAVIRNAPARTTQFNTPNAKTHIDTSTFSVDLPAGWQTFNAVTNVTPPTASYRSNGEQIQMLSVYIDNIPSNLAVNRVVIVSSEGNGMSHGSVSDNCTSFTNPTSDEEQKGYADGKWQGTTFLCDVGNYERNVVGITSPEGVNEVTLTGDKSGRHKVFITYTDNAINPNFSVFYDILSSFKLK